MQASVCVCVCVCVCLSLFVHEHVCIFLVLHMLTHGMNICVCNQSHPHTSPHSLTLTLSPQLTHPHTCSWCLCPLVASNLFHRPTTLSPWLGRGYWTELEQSCSEWNTSGGCMKSKVCVCVCVCVCVRACMHVYIRMRVSTMQCAPPPPVVGCIQCTVTNIHMYIVAQGSYRYRISYLLHHYIRMYVHILVHQGVGVGEDSGSWFWCRGLAGNSDLVLHAPWGPPSDMGLHWMLALYSRDCMVSFSSGLVLSVKTPVLAGAPVVLAPEPCPHTATGLKGTVDMSRDKACHTSHGRQQTPLTADTSTLLTHHDRSHHNAEELRLSRLPSWRKRLAVQAEETTLRPSEDHQRCNNLCSQTAQAA